MRALSIRQPFAELILRGIKTSEFRSRSTRIIGERFYIYASKGLGVRGQGLGKGNAWSEDLRAGTPPAWMVELAEQIRMIEPELLGGAVLPTGVIVGSAVIEKVTEIRGQESGVRGQESGVGARESRGRSAGIAPPLLTPDACHLTPSSLIPSSLTSSSIYEWHLTDVQRVKTFRKPKGHPQPVWFEPF